MGAAAVVVQTIRHLEHRARQQHLVPAHYSLRAAVLVAHHKGGRPVQVVQYQVQVRQLGLLQEEAVVARVLLMPQIGVVMVVSVAILRKAELELLAMLIPEAPEAMQRQIQAPAVAAAVKVPHKRDMAAPVAARVQRSS